MLSVRITHVTLVGCRGLIFSFRMDKTPTAMYINACVAAILEPNHGNGLKLN